jgi:hypothetical protein
MANPLRIRLGVHNLSDAQIAAFRSSYQQMMGIADNRGYQYLAGLHGVPSWYCWHHQQNAHSAQQLQLFLPWHRAYLYNWEMAMRDRVPDVTLPWWIGRRVRRAKVASRRSSASPRLTASQSAHRFSDQFTQHQASARPSNRPAAGAPERTSRSKRCRRRARTDRLERLYGGARRHSRQCPQLGFR